MSQIKVLKKQLAKQKKINKLIMKLFKMSQYYRHTDSNNQ